jgi:hypothetical protein
MERRVKVEGSGVAVGEVGEKTNVTNSAEVTVMDPPVVLYVVPLKVAVSVKVPLGREVNEVISMDKRFTPSSTESMDPLGTLTTNEPRE